MTVTVMTIGVRYRQEAEQLRAVTREKSFLILNSDADL